MKNRWLRIAAMIAILLIAWSAANAQRRQNSFGASRNSGSSRSSNTANAAAPAGSANLLKSFDILKQRNIFDPNRMPYRPTAPAAAMPQRPARADSIALVGTFLSNGKRLAIFDGSVAGAKGTFSVGDTVGGMELQLITTERVQLHESSRTIDLPVGASLTRRANEPWRLAAGGGSVSEAAAGEAPGAAAGATTATAAAMAPPQAPPGMSDFAKQMMLRRQKELGQKETKP